MTVRLCRGQGQDYSRVSDGLSRVRVMFMAG